MMVLAIILGVVLLGIFLLENRPGRQKDDSTLSGAENQPSGVRKWLPLLFVLLTLGVSPAFSQEAPAADKHEISEQIADSDKHMGTWMGKAWKGIVDDVAGFFGSITDGIENALTSVVDAMAGFWNSISAFFDILTDLLKRALSEFGKFFVWLNGMLTKMWDWAREFFMESILWLDKTYKGLWSLLSSTFQKLWGDAWVWIMDTGLWLLDWFYRALDWFVGIVYDFFMWLMDAIPAIALPPDWRNAVTKFISYAMILDKVAPVKEAFGLFVIYMGILMGVMVYRIIKSFIPTVAS